MSGMDRKPVDSRKTALLVLGMHRSGTSAMSRVLSLSGAALPEKVMPAALGNDLGHWEAQDVADLNDRILTDLDSGWDDIFGPHRNSKARIPSLKYLDAATKVIRDNWADRDVIVVKEPRLNLLVELWSQALKDEGYRPTYIIMVRHPLEVADSLKKRNNFARNRSLILWGKYMLSADRGTRDYPRIFVKYDDLLNDPEAVIDRIESSLDVVLPRRSWRATAEIDRFLTTDARHHYANGKSVRKTLPAIQNYYEYIESAALGAPANDDASSALRDWLANLEKAVGPILATLELDLREAKKSVETQTALITEANARLAAAEASFTGREQQLIAEIEESKANVANLRSELELENARLQNALDAATTESLLYKTTSAEHAEEAAHARGELEEALSRFNHLKEARQALEDRIREMEAERVKFAGDLEAACVEIADLKTSEAQARQALADRVREMEAERVKFAGDLEAACVEIAHLKTSDAQARQALADRVREMEAERVRFAGEIEAACVEIADLKNSEAQARQALEDRIQRIEANRQAERDQLEVDLKAARTQIAALTHLEAAARRAIDVRVREVEAERDAERDHFTRDLEDTRAQLADLTDLEAAARSVLEDRVRDVETERNHFAKDLEEARAQVAALTHLEAETRRDLEERVRDIESEHKLVRDDLAHELKAAYTAINRLSESERQARRKLEQTLQSVHAEYDAPISIDGDQSNLFSTALDEMLFTFNKTYEEYNNSRLENQMLADALAKQRKLSEDLSQTLADTIIESRHPKGVQVRQLFGDLLRRVKSIP